MFRRIVQLTCNEAHLTLTSNYSQSPQEFIRTRGTFVLKRRWSINLAKINNEPRRLRPKHYVYDLVDAGVYKHEPMEVILTSFVEGVGKAGDIITAKPNFVYRNLLLPKLAVYKTPENIEKYAKKDNDTEAVFSSKYAPKTQQSLENVCVNVVMNKDHPWTIEPWHLRASLRKAGYVVDEQAISKPLKDISGPDLELEGKEFLITVTINNKEKARVRCQIHHFSSVPSNRVPYKYGYWREPAGAVFPEEDDELKEKYSKQAMFQKQDVSR